MSLGKNLQILRDLQDGMSQEELADKIGIVRKTMSKWERDVCLPDAAKAMEICDFFNCTLDELFRTDMEETLAAFSAPKTVQLGEMHCFAHSVVSSTPEDDALLLVEKWASKNWVICEELIGWDFPFVSDEQQKTYGMHGYTAACTLRAEHFSYANLVQPESQYVTVTVTDPMSDPFSLIPAAYRLLHRYMKVKGLTYREIKDGIPCFEKTYTKRDTEYMDIYIPCL